MDRAEHTPLPVVHPRMGGEQILLIFDEASGIGSSPHGRGTVALPHNPRVNHRFIPAWAGNSPGDNKRLIADSVHPRMGGEQTSYNIL